MTSAKRKVEIAERPAQIPRKHRTIYDSRTNEDILIIDSGGAFRTYDPPELTISGHTPVFPQVIQCSLDISIVVHFLLDSVGKKWDNTTKRFRNAAYSEPFNLRPEYFLS